MKDADRKIRQGSANGAQQKQNTELRQPAATMKCNSEGKPAEQHAEAASRIQQLWRRYRESVDEMQPNLQQQAPQQRNQQPHATATTKATTTATSTSTVLVDMAAAAVETIQRSWKAYHRARFASLRGVHLHSSHFTFDGDQPDQSGNCGATERDVALAVRSNQAREAHDDDDVFSSDLSDLSDEDDEEPRTKEANSEREDFALFETSLLAPRRKKKAAQHEEKEEEGEKQQRQLEEEEEGDDDDYYSVEATLCDEDAELRSSITSLGHAQLPTYDEEEEAHIADSLLSPNQQSLPAFVLNGLRTIQLLWKRRQQEAVKAAAARNIQRRWRNYRHALDKYELAESNADSVTEEQLAEAAARIQVQWHRYKSALAQQQQCAEATPADNNNSSSNNAVATAQSSQPRSSGNNSHRAVHALWRGYQEALYEASTCFQQAFGEEEEEGQQQEKPTSGRQEESTATSASQLLRENEAAVSAAARRIQEAWSLYTVAAIASGERVRARTNEDDDDLNDLQEEEESAAAAAPNESAAAHVQHHNNNHGCHRQVAAGGTAIATGSPFRRGEAAARLIQRHWRNYLCLRDERQRYSDEFIHALRAVQSRFRVSRIRRIVRERDREHAAARVQELWRRRRDLRGHYRALTEGRQHNAAQTIQQMFRRRTTAARSSGEDDPHTRAEAAGSQRPTAPAGLLECRLPFFSSSSPPQPFSAAAPTCIVCLEESVQVALVPCGHTQLCLECASHLTRCPSCRKLVALQIRVYF